MDVNSKVVDVGIIDLNAVSNFHNFFLNQIYYFIQLKKETKIKQKKWKQTRESKLRRECHKWRYSEWWVC